MKYDQIKSLFGQGCTIIDSSTMVTSRGFGLAYRLETLGPKVLIETIESMFRKDNEEIIECRIPSESLISALTAFEASDPRDIFYAVLSLAKDSKDNDPNYHSSELVHKFIPDYEKDLVEVCTDFVNHYVDGFFVSQSLDVICRHWAPIPTRFIALTSNELTKGITLEHKNWVSRRPLPYWMPPINNGPRTTRESLVGPPQRRIYNAAARTKVNVEFGTMRESVESSKSRNALKKLTSNGIVSNDLPLRMIPDGRLSCLGLQVDVVDKVSGNCMSEIVIISSDALGLGGVESDTDEPINDVPDELCRTIVADRGPDGSYPPRWYRRACLRALESRRSNGDLDTNQLIHLKYTPSIVTDFLKRVRDVVSNRRFFRSQYENRLGLAPDDARVGDIICILYSCSVTVILRPVENERYVLIGECYLHGMMEGEATKSAAKLIEKQRIFTLQ